MASDAHYGINDDVNPENERLTPHNQSLDFVDIESPEVCVICLDRISEKARALPCNHDEFDFPCLGTWLQQQRRCPLCKAPVKAIRYHDDEKSQSKIFHLPDPELPRRSSRGLNQRRGQATRYTPYNRGSRGYGNESRRSSSDRDLAVDFRRRVYQDKTPSLHVGTNRFSKYRNIVPSTFETNPYLVTRAKAFIRRELSVFDFLNPTSDSFGSTDRRASNAEFLLEYIISILKSIDLKGSTGQAEELLKDFLGRDHARLFLHELEAWLRSPYEKLEDWDRHVQYAPLYYSGP